MAEESYSPGRRRRRLREGEWRIGSDKAPGLYGVTPRTL